MLPLKNDETSLILRNKDGTINNLIRIKLKQMARYYTYVKFLKYYIDDLFLEITSSEQHIVVLMRP